MKKPTVLIAEDAPMLREMMAVDLQEHGVHVELAKNGAEAITAIHRKRPSLLLLDLLMPKKDGFAVLQDIKEKGYHFPVVVLSNLSDPVLQRKCLELGAKEFIVKSQLDDGDLWQRVRGYLRTAE